MIRKTSKGWFCLYCKRGPLKEKGGIEKLALTFDHMMPKVFGGRSTYPCCRQCNGLKGSLRPREWWWFVEHHPRYWKTFHSTADVVGVILQERLRRVRAGEEAISLHLMGHERANGPATGRFVG